MRCPFCHESDTLVKNSRQADCGDSIRRRRQCKSCAARFTTSESLQIKMVSITKRSGFKKPLDKSKILKSITTATRKRNISSEEIEQMTDKICLKLTNSNEKEIQSKDIGKLIMQELVQIDQVAYIRFASVYKDFNNIQDFTKFINKLKKTKS
ncbi:MAG TPA: transcriptional regulator NrdR [Candidatus Megaira endosymbiont of Nemacystus decipiens]|nr:transcriptional regulator NrdR [Candidatus Megaera endosymbiont of Nemacystus decipiens]